MDLARVPLLVATPFPDNAVADLQQRDLGTCLNEHSDDVKVSIRGCCNHCSAAGSWIHSINWSLEVKEQLHNFDLTIFSRRDQSWLSRFAHAGRICELTQLFFHLT